MKVQKRFPAKVDQLPNVLEMVVSIEKQSALSGKQKMEIELVVEELFVNICNYAYPKGSGDAEITVRCEKGIEICLRDWGEPFNPLEYKKPDESAHSLEDTRIGGLGIFLVFELADHINYVREEGANVLSLRMA